MRIKITTHNVWTSGGKLYQGLIVDLPEDEAKALVSAGKADKVRGRSPKPEVTENDTDN